MRIAALDLGTNTFRLLIADVVGQDMTVLAKDQAMTRLGGGYDKKKNLLSDEAIARSLAVIEKFGGVIAELKPEVVRAAATEITRRAKNGREFIRLAGEAAGIEIDTIPPDEEAALAFKGIASFLPDDFKGQFVTLDVGGGSTEWAFGDEKATMIGWTSIPIGVVELAEKTMMGDPPTAGSLECMERQVWESVENVPGTINAKLPLDIVIGTGGTATSLAVIDMGMDTYDEERVQNYRLSVEKIEAIEKRLKSLTFSERAKIFPLMGGREDLIIPGAVLTRITCQRFGAKELMVSDAGLLEGLLLSSGRNNERR